MAEHVVFWAFYSSEDSLTIYVIIHQSFSFTSLSHHNLVKLRSQRYFNTANSGLIMKVDLSMVANSKMLELSIALFGHFSTHSLQKMHLPKLNCGYFFLFTVTIMIAFVGQFLLQAPQPMQRLLTNMGWPRRFSGNDVFSKGYCVVAGLVKMYAAAVLKIWGNWNLFAIFFAPTFGQEQILELFFFNWWLLANNRSSFTLKDWMFCLIWLLFSL